MGDSFNPVFQHILHCYSPVCKWTKRRKHKWLESLHWAPALTAECHCYVPTEVTHPYIGASRTSCCLVLFPSSVKTSFCDTLRDTLSDTSALPEKRNSTALLWMAGWQVVIRRWWLIPHPPLVCQAPTVCGGRFFCPVSSCRVCATCKKSLGF